MDNGRRWKPIQTIDLLPVTGPVLGDTCLKLCRIIDRQNTERRIQDVTSHVTQCACTKWIPRAPAPGSIYGIVVIVLRWSQPEIPVQCPGSLELTFGQFEALRPNGTIRPGMYGMNITDQTRIMNLFCQRSEEHTSELQSRGHL